MSNIPELKIKLSNVSIVGRLEGDQAQRRQSLKIEDVEIEAGAFITNDDQTEQEVQQISQYLYGFSYYGEGRICFSRKNYRKSWIGGDWARSQNHGSKVREVVTLNLQAAFGFSTARKLLKRIDQFFGGASDFRSLKFSDMSLKDRVSFSFLWADLIKPDLLVIDQSIKVLDQDELTVAVESLQRCAERQSIIIGSIDDKTRELLGFEFGGKRLVVAQQGPSGLVFNEQEDVAKSARKAAAELVLSGATGVAIERMREYNQLPSPLSCDTKGFKFQLQFGSIEDGLAWLQAAIGAGMIISSFSDAPFVRMGD
jgi:hypothetical protein